MAGDKEQRQSQGTERERELAELFARYVDRLNQGEKLDPERILADHPALGQELLECLEGYVDYPREGGSDEPLGTLGDYTLRREIGRGGMGIVYDAWQNSMDRRVALKVLPAAVAADNKSFTRFMREARTAGQLNHPNIVAVHAMGVDQKTPYYAMEFVDGETLADILERLEAEGEQDASDASVRISRLFIRSEKRTGGDKISVDVKRTGSEKRTGGKKSTGVAVGTAAGALTEAVRSAEQAVRSGAAAGPEAILEARAEADADAAAVAATAAAASPTRAAPGKEARETIGYASLANAFAGVADGLHHAHSRGVVHRDIKPSNLILDHGSDAGGASHVRVRILDFGLARLEGQEKLTASGEFLGTPLYVSPEQAQARKIPVDHRTDVYSLGTTMYELLTLRPPFKGRDYQDTLSQIISKDPSAPRGFNPRVPRDLETIVLKCLRKAPQDRYGTAEALAQDLRRFARGEPIEAQPQPAWEKLARRAWRSRARLALASLALLLAVVSAAFAYREWRAQNDAWAREYSEKVLGAVARLEMALSLPETPKSGSWGRFVRTMAVGGITAEWYAPPTHESVRSSPSVQSAVAPLEEAAKLLPSRPEAHYYLARARRILKQKAEAREALTLALESDGDFLPAVALEADILEEEGRKEEARRTRERLEEAQGGEWTGPWLDAWRAQRDEEWPRAIGAFERLLDLESSGFERYLGFSLAVRLGCGRARLSAGDFRGALEDFASARALWPGLAAPQILSAKALFLMGDRSGAEERLRKLAARAGGQDDLFLRIGEILLDLGEYEAALGWVSQAPESPDRESLRGTCFYYLGSYAEEEKAARRGLELGPEDADTRRGLHSDLASALREQGRFDEAIDEYLKAIELDRKHAWSHVGLSHAYLEKGELDLAIDSLKTAMSLDPENVCIPNVLSTVLAKQGLADEAMEAARKAVALNSKHFASRHNLAVLLENKGQLEEAVQEYKKALELDPRRPEIHHRLAHTLQKLERTEEAIPHYRKVIEIDPQDWKIRTCLAPALEELGRVDEAVAECEKAAAITTDEVARQRTLARLYSKLGRHEDAIAAARKILEIEPENLWALNSLGVFLSDARRPEEAIEVLRRTLELNPQDASALSNLGATLSDMERYEEAIPVIEKAIEIEPKDPVQRFNRACSLRELGRVAEAFPEYWKCIQIDPAGPPSFISLGDIDMILRRKQVEGIEAEIPPLVEALERCLTRRSPPPNVRETLALALTAPSPARNPAKAIECTEKLIELTGGRAPVAFELQAEIRSRIADSEGAVGSMERALAISGQSREYIWPLEEYREAVRPDLPTYASIDAAVDGPDFEAVVREGDEWRFFRGKAEPSAGLEWTEASFDDSGWEAGPSGFGYGDDDDGTVLGDMRGAYSTVYIRKAIEVDDPGSWKALWLSIRADDACVAYFNGVEVGRVKAGEMGARLPFDALAATEPREPLQPVEFALPRALIRAGRNVLAIQGLNHRKASYDFSLIPEVRGERLPRCDEALRWSRVVRALEALDSPETQALIAELARQDAWSPGAAQAEAALARRGGAAAAVYANEFEEAQEPEADQEGNAPQRAQEAGGPGEAAGGAGAAGTGEALDPAKAPAEAERLWEALASRDAGKANAALSRLVSAGRDAIPFLQERIQAGKGDRERQGRELLEFRSRKLDAFRSSAKDEKRVAYLEGRLLQKMREFEGAAGKYGEVLEADAGRHEPWLRLAQCLRAMGDAAGAEARLRETLGKGVEDPGALWSFWFAICAADLKLGAAEILARMPAGAPGAAELPRRAANLRWALESLAKSGSLRINCGGGEFRSDGGTVWGDDRWFTSGCKLEERERSISGTTDAPLYQAARAFRREDRSPRGYRIPLPAGRYRIGLGFAEISFKEPGKRRFDVALEGKVVLSGYEPKVDAAETLAFDAKVEDGQLDLEFVRELGDPLISAISIEALK